MTLKKKKKKCGVRRQKLPNTTWITQTLAVGSSSHRPRRGNGRPHHPPLNDGAVPLFSLFGSFHLIFQPLKLCRGNPDKSLAVFRGGHANNQCSSVFNFYFNRLAILASFSSVFFVFFLHNATDTVLQAGWCVSLSDPPNHHHHHHKTLFNPPPTSSHPAIQPVPASSCIGRCLFLYFLFALS